eukprot:CAMPEP_0119302450 /NCGR_PEP_ID=MMETSP1333-20130426/4038_1 /TAXON_ID=418940 /ORGANISM="Scyphosphaera apsteinii, Strain RCC1455" /LENGTH=542 /DNA_ID=CAMNT_0007304797 /DNA_START=62 /DNA_END=1690 /DNA_ORIENTATION=+
MDGWNLYSLETAVYRKLDQRVQRKRPPFKPQVHKAAEHRRTEMQRKLADLARKATARRTTKQFAVKRRLRTAVAYVAANSSGPHPCSTVSKPLQCHEKHLLSKDTSVDILKALAVVVSRLSAIHFTKVCSLAVAARGLWRNLVPITCPTCEAASIKSPSSTSSRCRCQMRSAATLYLQRTQRGRIARRGCRDRAKMLAVLVSDFVEKHPHWQRTCCIPDSMRPRLMIGTRLGNGAFGCVYKPKAVWHLGRVAVKAVSLRSVEAASGVALEAALLQLVAETSGKHPNLITLHGTFIAGEHARLTLDLANGDLYDYMWRWRGALQNSEALTFSRQIAAGLRHLHQSAVAHRDLKLSNFLVCAGEAPHGCAIKIGDLGLGIHSDQLTRLENGRAVVADPCGTLVTMAPEVIGARWYCPYKADSWSLGICLLAILAPRPFDEDEPRAAFYPFLQAHPLHDADYSAFTAPSPPLPPGLCCPPGLNASFHDNGPTSRLLRKRADSSFEQQFLPPQLLLLLDALLTPSPESRLCAVAAAQFLDEMYHGP